MPTVAPRAITYSRQSRARKDDSAAFPEAQRLKTRALVSAKGWTFAGHFERVALAAMTPALPARGSTLRSTPSLRGEASVLVVYRLDRAYQPGGEHPSRMPCLLG